MGEAKRRKLEQVLKNITDGATDEGKTAMARSMDKRRFTMLCEAETTAALEYVAARLSLAKPPIVIAVSDGSAGFGRMSKSKS